MGEESGALSTAFKLGGLTLALTFCQYRLIAFSSRPLIMQVVPSENEFTNGEAPYGCGNDIIQS